MKKLSFLAVVVLLAFLITSCTPTQRHHQHPPNKLPHQPEPLLSLILYVTVDGPKNNSKWRPVRFNRDVVFQELRPVVQ